MARVFHSVDGPETIQLVLCRYTLSASTFLFLQVIVHGTCGRVGIHV